MHRTFSLFLAVVCTTAVTACDRLADIAPLLAQVTTCGRPLTAQDLLKLAEGPAIFVDAVRVVVDEVGRQARSVGQALQGGVSLNGEALAAIGPYAWQGDGGYTREVSPERAFSLRFFYGTGITGKTAGVPLEADLTRIDSYVPDALALLNPSGPRGPLFPLVQATGLTTGRLNFRDEALRLAVGSTASATLKGYALQLALSTRPMTASELLAALKAREVSLDLRDTSLRAPAKDFALTIKRFELTVGLDGSTRLGGEYVVALQSGALRYVGAVTQQDSGPRISLRCEEDAASEFAAVAWADGKPELSWRGGRTAFTIAPLTPVLTENL